MKQFIVQCLNNLERRLILEAKGEYSVPGQMPLVKEVIRKLSQAYAELRISPIPQLPLELAIVEFCGNAMPDTPPVTSHSSAGILGLEQLTQHWPDFIAATKPFNHSVAGFLRSARPKSIKNGIVTIEAFYPFHQEKLSETKVVELLETTLRKLFGEKVKVEIVLGKK